MKLNVLVEVVDRDGVPVAVYVMDYHNPTERTAFAARVHDALSAGQSIKTTPVTL